VLVLHSTRLRPFREQASGRVVGSNRRRYCGMWAPQMVCPRGQWIHYLFCAFIEILVKKKKKQHALNWFFWIICWFVLVGGLCWRLSTALWSSKW